MVARNNITIFEKLGPFISKDKLIRWK